MIQLAQPLASSGQAYSGANRVQSGDAPICLHLLGFPISRNPDMNTPQSLVIAAILVAGYPFLHSIIERILYPIRPVAIPKTLALPVLVEGSAVPRQDAVDAISMPSFVHPSLRAPCQVSRRARTSMPGWLADSASQRRVHYLLASAN
ncbi:hypothetical protein OU994_10425 [Pseudoduganella sp. SL102]|uniref:hypothetical protein n=1 Tax=Pseudoduganella sp. SL102 TaxID=2995154 RepID=UPI00248CE057|nr:hypothetical protein [Pseudoduganella sp. SL102]WBS04656.1 hypothetical protein OU994_10425 [Pseudoduganella sp. SL102]